MIASMSSLWTEFCLFRNYSVLLLQRYFVNVLQITLHSYLLTDTVTSQTWFPPSLQGIHVITFSSRCPLSLMLVDVCPLNQRNILLENTIEWFSFECRKTKTKVITLANHIGHRQYTEPIKTRSNYMWLTQSAGKSCERVTIGFGFTSDWMKRWRESFKPIASCRKCKTNYFSTLKWKPL